LSRFFKKIAFKKGRQKAITATARKIAIIIYNMIVKKQPYNPPEQYLFLDQKRKQVAHLRSKIAKFGINPDELGIFSRPEYEAKYHRKMNTVNQVVT
jgi:pyoverdine/dityrosine biosynthesis protein Dit1